MTNNLIHAASIRPEKRGKILLFLRKESPHEYRWHAEENESERPTEVWGETPEAALKNAHYCWKLDFFKTFACGFRYTLPERDEHGMNALLHQMIASLSSMNGIYFDEELGHNCFVQNASDEAISLWHDLRNKNRL